MNDQIAVDHRGDGWDVELMAHDDGGGEDVYGNTESRGRCFLYHLSSYQGKDRDVLGSDILISSQADHP